MSYVLGAILELKDKGFSSNVKESASATEDLKNKLDNTEKSNKKFGDGLKKVGKGVAVATGAIVGLGAAAFAATKKVTDGFDNIAKTSKKLGISTDAYQEMEYWGSQNGLAANDMERAVGRLNQRIGLAAEGNDKYASALERLNVDMKSVQDGTLSTEEVMHQSIQTLSQMTNEQEKSALASELFGTKLARELMPALQDGSLSLEDATKKAKELGIVIDNDTLSAAEHFNDTWDDLTRSASAFGQKALAGMMPFFQGVMDFAIDKLPKAQSFISTSFDKVGTAIDWVKEKGTLAFNIIKERIEQNEPAISSVRDLFTQVWEKVGDVYEVAKSALSWIGEEGIPIVANAIGELIEWSLNLYTVINDNWSKIEPFVIGIAIAMGTWKAITMAQTAVTTVMTAKQWLLNAALNANPIGLVVLGIGLLIGAGIALYKNWDTVKAKATELWTNLKERFAGIKDAIMKPLEPVMSFFGRLKETWDSFKNSISNFKMPKIGLPKWMGGDGLIQGSHKTGLNRVPHDGYVAELHRDEAVLPKREADLYRKGRLNEDNSTVNQSTTTNRDSSRTITIEKLIVNSKATTLTEMVDDLVAMLKLRLANM